MRLRPRRVRWPSIHSWQVCPFALLAGFALLFESRDVHDRDGDAEDLSGLIEGGLVGAQGGARLSWNGSVVFD